MKRFKVLIDLDSIFDTRLGTVMVVNPEWGDPLLDSDYLKRYSNKLSLCYPPIDDDLIEARWLTRDMEVLRASYSTNILNLLINNAKVSNLGDPEHPEAIYMSVVVNTYPYELSRNETVTLFTYLRELLGIERVTQVIMPISELTPMYLKGNFNKVILHRFQDWEDCHLMSLPDNPIPTIMFTAPLWFCKGKETMEYAEGMESQIEMVYGAHLRLELLRLSDFSICPPVEPIEPPIG